MVVGSFPLYQAKTSQNRLPLFFPQQRLETLDFSGSHAPAWEQVSTLQRRVISRIEIANDGDFRERQTGTLDWWMWWQSRPMGQLALDSRDAGASRPAPTLERGSQEELYASLADHSCTSREGSLTTTPCGSRTKPTGRSNASSPRSALLSKPAVRVPSRKSGP
ncbi:hypothetical protein CCP4SC76_5780005 [Gammaproteobacteria bacterium]